MIIRWQIIKIREGDMIVALYEEGSSMLKSQPKILFDPIEMPVCNNDPIGTIVQALHSIPTEMFMAHVNASFRNGNFFSDEAGIDVRITTLSGAFKNDIPIVVNRGNVVVRCVWERIFTIWEISLPGVVGEVWFWEKLFQDGLQKKTTSRIRRET